VHLLEIDAALEPGKQEQRVARIGLHRSHAAKDGLDMIDRCNSVAMRPDRCAPTPSATSEGARW
jgi:hypothetical protein